MKQRLKIWLKEPDDYVEHLVFPVDWHSYDGLLSIRQDGKWAIFYGTRYIRKMLVDEVP
jgi:hypothetical protein